jgi:hypothetical protein
MGRERVMKSIFDYFPAPTKEDYSRFAKKFDAMSEKEKKQLEQNLVYFFEAVAKDLIRLSKGEEEKMIEDYKMKNEHTESLVGLVVTEALINEQKDYVLLKTDKGDKHLTWEGECCANCFIAHIEGAENLAGSTIVSVKNTEWVDLKRNRDECEVIEHMGTKIKTTKGIVEIETRVEHNGYYGGEICVNSFAPMDQYACPRDKEAVGKYNMTPMKDF